jgi:hypothetical protein
MLPGQCLNGGTLKNMLGLPQQIPHLFGLVVIFPSLGYLLMQFTVTTTIEIEQ